MKEEIRLQFDDLIITNKYAALVMRQLLKPVEGDNAVVYPPTFAAESKDKKSGYNIDTFPNTETGELMNVCLIDSVGSQANRMEPLFKEKAYSHLIPQIKIELQYKADNSDGKKDTRKETINLVDAGHRIADAVIRLSNASSEIEKAFKTLKQGDAEKIAKLAPTSLVFGCWDSRGTGVKVPRVVRASIRALNVHPLKRSAQYIPASYHFSEAISPSSTEKKKLPDAGMGHVPSTGDPGGVMLDKNSQILREAVLSLSVLRSLKTEDDNRTLKLQRYLLGLSLVSFTASQDSFLRMGCELTGNPDNHAIWEMVQCDGSRKSLTIKHEDTLSYAKSAAEAFGVGKDKTFQFDPKKAKEALKKKTESE